jgi:hypothetical protein
LLAGMTAGTALKLNDRWTFAPALGVFSKVEGGRRASLLADASFNYMLTGGGYVGTGLTFWDITHGDNRTIGWLAGAGVPVWKNDVRKHQLQTVIEWRQMFNEAQERSDARRMVWVGLRYLFK